MIVTCSSSASAPSLNASACVHQPGAHHRDQSMVRYRQQASSYETGPILLLRANALVFLIPGARRSRVHDLPSAGFPCVGDSGPLSEKTIALGIFPEEVRSEHHRSMPRENRRTHEEQYSSLSSSMPWHFRLYAVDSRCSIPPHGKDPERGIVVLDKNRRRSQRFRPAGTREVAVSITRGTGTWVA